MSQISTHVLMSQSVQPPPSSGSPLHSRPSDKSPRSTTSGTLLEGLLSFCCCHPGCLYLQCSSEANLFSLVCFKFRAFLPYSEFYSISDHNKDSWFANIAIHGFSLKAPKSMALKRVLCFLYEPLELATTQAIVVLRLISSACYISVSYCSQLS